MVIPTTPELSNEKVTETPPVNQEKTENAESSASSLTFSSPVQEANWKKFRDEREKERAAKAEAEKLVQQERERSRQKEEENAALKAALEQIVNKTSQDPPPEEDQEKIIEKKIAAALSKQQRDQEEARKKREIAEMPERLNQTYQDFNRVVTNENVDYLAFHYPEVWAAYKNSPESYETWSGLYKALKRFIPNLDGKQEAARIQKNLNKPQSMSQPGMSASGDITPNIKLEDKYKSNWARMQKTLKGIK